MVMVMTMMPEKLRSTYGVNNIRAQFITMSLCMRACSCSGEDDCADLPLRLRFFICMYCILLVSLRVRGMGQWVK